MAKLDLSNLKKTLQDAVDKKNADKAQEDQIRQQKNQEDRNTMLESMSKDFGSVFKPYLDKIQEHSKLSSEELSRIIAQSVKVSVPDVNTEKLSTAIEAAITKSMGAIRIPTPNHTVNVPPIRIPPISMPEQMDIKGWIGVMGYDKGLLQNPLPVQIRDAQGNPVDLRQQAIQMMAGGGGKMDFFTINGITNTVGVVQINPDGSPFYSGSSVSGGGSTNVALVNVDGLYYNSDNPLPVTFAAAASQPVSQVSGASWSVNVVNSSSATSVALLNSDGQTIDPRDRNWALTETLNVLQLSGAVNSVNVVGPIAQGDAATALRVVIAGNSDSSVSATQVGTWNITTLTSITNSVAASLVDSSGVGYSGSNPLPVVFGASATQGVNIVDSSGIGYSGSNPVPTAVTGITNSVAVVALDRDGNPLTTGPIGNGDQATALRVIQAGDAVASVYVNNPVAQGDAATALRVVIAGNSDASVSAIQSGTWNVTTLTSITNSVAAALVDSGGVAYSGSNPLPVVFGASATQGVNVVDSSGVAYSGTNPVPTAVTGITNSVAVVALDRDGNPLTTGPLDNGDSATALRVVIAGNSAASVSATQVGTWNITTLTGITNSVAASLVDSSGVQYSGSNPLPVVFGASATQAVNVVDSSGVAYSGTNPVPTAVTGITNSVAVVALDRDGNPLTTGPLDNGDSATALRVVIAGNSAASVSATQVGTWNIATLTGITNSVAASIVDSSGIQYSGSNPLPISIVSGSPSTTAAVLTRQTNPPAVAADYVPFSADDLGRQLTRPIQVRDLMATAFVSVTTGTETTLLAAGGAGVFLDLIFLKLTNNSSVAVGVDIRDVTAGGVIDHYEIPANGSVGGALPVPYPQGNANNNWTIDLPDITGTTVTAMALFSKEI